ncbi:MAG: LysR family transcriptional regulator [Candidatus Caenarcaniphilales bacterium]|nr:LysR family transcriptional regulator [Candidatus Caenarcaniphilales bacterium]
MRTLDNWDDLKFFLAVATNGNLSKAARCLAVNHSTVFRRIEGLESDLAVSLFHKMPSGYVLTPEGEELFQTVQTIEDNLDLVSKKLSGKNNALKGSIRIITTDSMASIHLPRYTREFRELYPEISIEILVGTSYLEDGANSGDNDIFIYAGVSPPEHWVGRRLGVMTFSIYGANSYLEQYGTPASINELKDHSYLCGSVSHLSSWPVVKWLKENIALLNPEKVIYSNSFAVLFCLLKQGLGLSMFPDAHCERDLSLTKLFDFSDKLKIEVWVVTHPSVKDKTRIRTFVDFLADRMVEDKIFKN